jgi:hypothetical protein
MSSPQSPDPFSSLRRVCDGAKHCSRSAFGCLAPSGRNTSRPCRECASGGWTAPSGRSHAVGEVSAEEVERRVAHAILRLARQAGRKVEAGVEIDFPITRQDVAEMTGTTLHTVSRILSSWESKGLVEGGRQRTMIRDSHKLFMIAEGASD